jgi:hypothetical protein
MGDMGTAYRIYSENLKGRDCLNDLGKYGKILLKSFLNMWGTRAWTACI